MQQEIEALLALQEDDLKIREIEAQITALDPQLVEFDKKRDQVLASLAKAEIAVAAEEKKQRELIRAMLFARSRVEQITEKLGDESFREPQYRAIYQALIAAQPEAPIDEVTAHLDDDPVGTDEDLLAEGSYQMDPERTISDSLATLRARDLDLRAAELDRIIPLVDGAQKDQLIAEKDEIRKELKATGKNYYKKFRRSGAR